MDQAYPSRGLPAGPPRPPAPVLTAVKLMHASAAVSIVSLIISLAIAIGDPMPPAAGDGLATASPRPGSAS